MIRYGTTTFIIPPFNVLHASIMNNDPEKLRQAAEAEAKPMVIVTAKDFSGQEGTEKKMLKEAGLWLL